MPDAGLRGAMMEGQREPLSAYTTLRIGGVPTRMIDADTESDLIEAVADQDEQSGLVQRVGGVARQTALSEADWQPLPADEAHPSSLLVLGEGSNLVVSDDPFHGLVVRDARRDFAVRDQTGRGGVIVEATAGASWDELVAYAITKEWSGLEALSGIPGTVGAAPVQNIGAYGREIGENLAYIRVYDRLTGQTRTMSRLDLKLGYRDSILKRSLKSRKAGGGRVWHHTGRWVVLTVALQLPEGRQSAPIRYAELARQLGVAVGDTAPMTEVREAVLALRASKGMVLDNADHDTWSAGSFFTNPILSEREADEVLPFRAPRYPVEASTQTGLATSQENPVELEGIVKTSAAWLIEEAGFEKGFGLTPEAQARLSTKHVLAITNRGAATSDDVRELALAVRDGVEHHFGIRLEPEPVLVGMSL